MHLFGQCRRVYSHTVRWLSRDHSSPTQPHPFSLFLHNTLSDLISCSPMVQRNVWCSMLFHEISVWIPLTSGVREAIQSSFPTIWAKARVFFVFIQASFAVDSPAARHLVWIAGHVKADLTNQFVRWCVHKIAVISTSVGSIGSHLLQTVWTTYFYNYMIITLMFYWFLAVNLPMLASLCCIHSGTQQLCTNFGSACNIKVGEIVLLLFTWAMIMCYTLTFMITCRH